MPQLAPLIYLSLGGQFEADGKGSICPIIPIDPIHEIIRIDRTNYQYHRQGHNPPIPPLNEPQSMPQLPLATTFLFSGEAASHRPRSRQI